MASSLPLLQQLREYVLRPGKEAGPEATELAFRLLGFPPAFEVATKLVFEQRRRGLVSLVAGSGLADAQQLSDVYELQNLVSACPLGLDEKGKKQLEEQASALLDSRWELWDPTGLWKQLQESLQRRASGSSLEEPRLLEKLLAVELLRTLPEEEYQEASERLGSEPRASPKNASIVLPHGSYSWQALERVYFVLQRMMAASAVHAWNFILPYSPQALEEGGVQDVLPSAPSPWQRDLVGLKNFSECVLTRAHAWSLHQDHALVSEVRKQLEKLTSLSIHGKVSTPQACAATVTLLRFFFRAVLRYLYALAAESSLQASLPLPPREEQMLAELLDFEEQLFLPRYPSNDFPQRLPALLLGRDWGIVYFRLKGLLDRGIVAREELLGPSFDQAKLLHLLPEEERAASQRLVASLQSLFKDTLEDAASHKSQVKASSHALLDLLQFETEDVRAVWRDEAAREVLLNFSRNQQKFSFRPPLFYGLRFEQLHRELPSAGSVLLFWQATPSSHERILEHPVQAPFEPRVLEANHARIFKCLPLGSAELRLCGEEAFEEATQRYACFFTDMGCFRYEAGARRQLLQRENFKILAATPSGSRYLSKEVVEALRGADTACFLEALSGLPELSCSKLPMERLRAVLFSAEDPVALAGRGILGLGQQQKHGFLRRLPRDFPVPVFSEERHADVVFYQQLRRRGTFHPCYCSGVVCPEDWASRETELLRSVLKDPRLRTAVELLLHGTRAVLFSDAPSGLLREERVCRLPLLYSKRKELVELLHRRGVALYFWCVSRSFKPPAEVRPLELEMVFDESENVYDWEVLRRKTEAERRAVEQHVLRCLRSFAPGSASFLLSTPERAASRVLLVLTRAEAPRREELRLASCKQVSVLVLGGLPPQPRPFASFHESRSFNEACLGQGCTRVACREIRGLCLPLVCEACGAWDLLPGSRKKEACQYVLEDGASCAAAATVQLRGSSKQLYPRFLCSSHAVLTELEPGARERINLQGSGPLLWKEVPASLGVRRKDTYPTSYCRKEDPRAPTFAEPLLHEECLEVQDLLKRELTSWMAEQEALVLQQDSRLLLCLEDRTKELLDACLSEAFPSTSGLPFVWSLESHKAESSQASLLQTLGSQELLECFLEDAAEGRRGEEQSSLGELPAAASGEEDQEMQELSPEACFSKALETYCERKGLLLSKQPQERTSVLGAIQDYVAFADDFFGSARHSRLQVFEQPLPGKKKLRWTEQVTLGWILAFQTLAAVEQKTNRRRSKNGLSWLACLKAELGSRKIFLQTRAAWRLVGALPSLREAHGPRSVLARLVSKRLLFSREPSCASQQLRDVQAGLMELYELHRRRSSLPEVALGVLHSCLAGLEESLEVSGRSFVAPLEFLRRIVLPRAQQVEDFEQLMDLLFVRHAEASERRPSPDVLQVKQLAQAFFWNEASAKRLRVLALEIKKSFVEAKLQVLKQQKKLGSCFSDRDARRQKKGKVVVEGRKAGARCSASRLLSSLEVLKRQLGAQEPDGALSRKKRKTLAEEDDAVSE